MKKRRNIEEIKHLFPLIKKYLKKVYGERLEATVLYGSFAKNKATGDSDIDIAVILKDGVNANAKIDKVNDFISDLGLKYNELITILFLSSYEVKGSIWPLYKSLQEEGIRL